MSPLAQTLLLNLGVIATVMTLVWLVSLALKDASIIDPCWGAGFVLVAGVSWLLNAPGELRVLLLFMLTAIWGLRLSIFLLWRNWGHGEDRRYTAMRDKHGESFWWKSWLNVFLLQAIILWFVSMPIQATAAKNPGQEFGWFDGLGCLLWSVGLFFETVGDWQLARFKSQPANQGRVMDRGLWRYTRHPNYFGDFCVWWGLYLIAVAGGASWTIASPLVMSLFLMKISGVSLLEKDISERRPAYVDYKARTNAFFPGPPRSSR